MAAKLEMLVPVELLPSEGEEIPKFESRNGSTTGGDLLKYYLELTGGSHLGFRIDRGGIEALNGAANGMPLQHSDFLYSAEGENEGQPWFDFSDRSETLDVTPILSGEPGVELEFEEGAGSQEFVRAFIEQFMTRVEAALGDLEGTAIPLLRWSESESGDGVEVGFCGVVLADGELLETLREEGKEGGVFDSSLGLVLEEPEIEGRGLREIAISLAIMGITVAATQNADAGPKRFSFGSNSAAVTTSSGSMMGALSGIKLFDGKRQNSNIQTIKANDQQAPARINQALLAESEGASRQVVVDVSKQRAYVIVNGEIAIDTPVSTAREGKHTPRGEFKITQRVRSGKTSTIYGCDLPYWQRLDQSAVGMHVGPLPGYPASAGCIRLPEQVAPIIFDATSSGITVRVVDSWEPGMQVASL